MKTSAKAVVAALCIGVAGAASAQGIQVQVDGNAVNFPYAQPRYIDGRVLVPLRGVFEQLGANVNWDPGTRMVTAIRGSQEVDLRIGDRNASVNGSTVSLDIPAMIVNGTTMVPIRFVSEALGRKSAGWRRSGS